MQTTKIILVIALTALATVAMGQRNYRLERHFPERNNHTAMLASDQKIVSSPVDLWIYDNNGWPSKKISYRMFESPGATRIIYFEQAELFKEEEISTEEWMTLPFETMVFEPELTIEPWMSTPFEYNIAEEELILESWMVTPFDAFNPTTGGL